MNTPIMRRLLGLETIPEDAGNLSLVFERDWPAWAWALALLAIVALAAWSYTRLEGPRGRRGVLAGLRALILTLALLLVAGPMAEMPREIVERDWVIMLLDRSASMTVVDRPDDASSRDAALRSALASNADLFAEMAAQRELRWFGFHEALFRLEDPRDAGAVPDPGPADGAATNLAVALDQTMQRAAARQVSAIVLMSDGRTSTPPARALIRQLQSEAIPLMVVPFGSPEPLGDLAIGAVQAPSRAFARDRVPVTVEVDRIGSGAAGLGGTVQLIDDLTGEVLDSVRVDPSEARSADVTLLAEPALAGEAAWRVEIVPDRPDLVEANNRRTIAIELVDRPLRVLYIDGYPRWEYRYIKNLLVREESIESSVMLLSADRDFAQEGNLPITRLPRTREEWAAFDVIVIGDVPGTFFSPDQLEQMRALVAEGGVGLLWVAGERSLPSTYAGTSLADLLPMRGTLRLAPIGTPVHLRPTALAGRLGLLSLGGVDEAERGWPRELADPMVGWSRLFWAQRIDADLLKPTAEILAETSESSGDSGPLPLVLQMRFGAGTSMYVATDEIWRWRYGRGELLPEQFWIQLIRVLGRESLVRGGEVALLSVSPRRAEARSPIRIAVTLLEGRGISTPPASLPAVIENAAGERVAEIELPADPDVPGRYSRTWIPVLPGTWRVRVRDASVPGLDLVSSVDIVTADEELRRPDADHDLLARLAAETGGRVLDPADLSELRSIRDRSIRTRAPLREPIWDTAFVFGLMLLLLTIEWIGRKMLRLP